VSASLVLEIALKFILRILGFLGAFRVPLNFINRHINTHTHTHTKKEMGF
jgi:hypothetical protein